MDNLASWREDRKRGWGNDIGYLMQDELGKHTYLSGTPTSKIGWHHCTCGWAGYWCDFHPHVADHLRALVTKWRPEGA